MSAVSLIAESLEMQENIFITKEYNKYGVYALRVCKDGEWVGVIIDDRIPCTAENEPVYIKVRVQKYYWSMIDDWLELRLIT